MNREIANSGSWVSVVSIVTGLEVGNRGVLVLFPARKRSFSLLQTMQIGYGAHRACYSMGAKDKTAEAYSEQFVYVVFDMKETLNCAALLI